MFKLKTTNGATKLVTSGALERLRMLADWQIRSEGIDPATVNAALRSRDDAITTANVTPERVAAVWLEALREYLAEAGCPTVTADDVHDRLPSFFGEMEAAVKKLLK
jgi:hypothetical protein